mmetsp:Transcript_27062/g.19512  ORF Transcript_27062/g.19512 Transcript_27062/m.19512 type:complete len:84 (-) Transcript_27062:2196-2447(-)
MRNLSLQIGGKVMMDFMSHFHANSRMKDIENAMHYIAIATDPCVMFTKQHGDIPSALLGFIKQYYLDDNCKYLFDIMFTCVDV